MISILLSYNFPCRWERHIRISLDGTLSFHFQVT